MWKLLVSFESMATITSELSWHDVERLAAQLATKLPVASGVVEFDRVIAVARGGLIPASLVAAALGVKRVETVQVALYDGSAKAPAPRLLGAAPTEVGPSGAPERTLVIDEMVDSGATLRFLQGLYPQASYAVLVARVGDATPETGGALARVGDADSAQGVWAAATLATERWILFPWSPAEDRAVSGAEGA